MFRSPFVPLALAFCFLFAPPLTLDAAPSVAADGSGFPGAVVKHAQRPAARLLPPPGYLGLDDAQQDATRALLESLADTVGPLREALRANRQAIKEAVDAPQPDPTAIGELVIESVALRGDQRDALTAFDEDLTALLDDGQRSKWQHYKELERLSRRPRGGDGGDDAGEGDFGIDG